MSCGQLNCFRQLEHGGRRFPLALWFQLCDECHDPISLSHQSVTKVLLLALWRSVREAFMPLREACVDARSEKSASCFQRFKAPGAWLTTKMASTKYQDGWLIL